MNLIIFGSGAYDASKFNPPVFQRHSWSNHFAESVIYYNDPTLYLGKINLGWGFGSYDRFYLEDISTILKTIIRKLNINNVMFYESSAGGFMSLILAGFIEGSKALVNNPQTIFTNYFARHVNSLLERAVPTLKREDVVKIFLSIYSAKIIARKKEFERCLPNYSL